MAVVTYKCPNCDGPLAFDPKSQQFACGYCRSSFTKEELDRLRPEGKESEPRPERAPFGEKEQESVAGAAVYSCPSCGAEIVTNDTTAATFCYYCHNPVILSGRLDGSLKPDAVIPFSIEKDKAVEAFLSWVKKKRFVPRGFFSKEQIEKLTGVYFPYWLVDCGVQGGLNAQATKVRTWVAGDNRYVETQHFLLIREGTLHFREIPKNALKKANRKLIEGVLPFDASGSREFSASFLSGFQAEKRDVEKEDLSEEVRGEVSEYTQNLLRGTISGYSTCMPTDQLANISSESWKYALLPVWVLTYKAKDKKMFYYAMNGQDGKVCGVLPIDGGRLFRLFAAVFLPVFLLLLAGGVSAMVKAFQKAAAFIALAQIMLLLSFSSLAQDRRVFDTAGLFSTEQEASLETAVAGLRSRISMDVVILTISDAKGKTAMAFADDYYDENGFGTGEDKSGVLFLIDMDNREAYISTSGRMIDILTDQRIEKILDDAYGGLSNQDYNAAAQAFLNDVGQYVSAGAAPGQYRYDTQTGKVVRERSLSGTDILISFLAALAAGAFACAAVAARYKMRFGTYRYPFGELGSLNLTRSEDVFVNQTVTVQKIPKSSGGGSGGGRSSVHTSSGGRSHGGGGRRF